MLQVTAWTGPLNSEFLNCGGSEQIRHHESYESEQRRRRWFIQWLQWLQCHPRYSGKWTSSYETIHIYGACHVVIHYKQLLSADIQFFQENINLNLKTNYQERNKVLLFWSDCDENYLFTFVFTFRICIMTQASRKLWRRVMVAGPHLLPAWPRQQTGAEGVASCLQAPWADRWRACKMELPGPWLLSELLASLHTATGVSLCNIWALKVRNWWIGIPKIWYILYYHQATGVRLHIILFCGLIIDFILCFRSGWLWFGIRNERNS